MENKYSVRPSARLEECVDGIIIGELLYKNANIVIGDSTKDKEHIKSDITINDQISIDAVRTELPNDFKFNTFTKHCKDVNYDINKCNRILHSKEFEDCGFEIIPYKSQTRQYIYFTNKDADDEHFYNELETCIDNKLIKCKEMINSNTDVRLCVNSTERFKDEEYLEKFIKIYNKLSEKYEKKFNVLYIIFTTGLYVYQGKELKSYSYDEKYNIFHQEAVKLFNNRMNIGKKIV